MSGSEDVGEDLGLGLHPGDSHYRAYVGPPEEYDLVAAMTFNLLAVLGLRQHHSLLDIGCGSLRVGRLVIPYLNRGNYVGIDPNRWLVEEGIQREVGEDQIRIKRARFVYSESPDALDAADSFDFAVAQSIFSHSGLDLIAGWLGGVSRHLKPTGALAATFIVGAEDYRNPGWVYPACVEYTMGTMKRQAADAGLEFRLLDWIHPRQTWALFAAPEYDCSWFEGRRLSWNTSLTSPAWRKP